jgi:hypothetical protein
MKLELFCIHTNDTSILRLFHTFELADLFRVMFSFRKLFGEILLISTDSLLIGILAYDAAMNDVFAHHDTAVHNARQQLVELLAAFGVQQQCFVRLFLNWNVADIVNLEKVLQEPAALHALRAHERGALIVVRFGDARDVDVFDASAKACAKRHEDHDCLLALVFLDDAGQLNQRSDVVPGRRVEPMQPHAHIGAHLCIPPKYAVATLPSTLAAQPAICETKNVAQIVGSTLGRRAECILEPKCRFVLSGRVERPPIVFLGFIGVCQATHARAFLMLEVTARKG